MNIKDFIKWLETFPPETTINVIRVTDAGYHGYDAEWIPFDHEEHSDFGDMRNNRFAKGKDWENDVDLYLGEK